MKWTDDKYAENKMRDFGAKWVIEEVKLSEIDWDESRMNSARLAEPIVQDMVDDFALAMERGDEFPRIAVLKRKGHRLAIVSGNHRGLAAKNNKYLTVPAYVISSDDVAVWDLLPRIFNRGHGLRQSKEEAIAHAIYAVQTHGYEPRKAAEMFGLNKHTINDELRIRALRDSLALHGVPEKKLVNAVIHKLGAISANENVLSSAAQVCVKAGMTSDAAGNFVAEIKKAKTEASQMAVVAEQEKKLLVLDPGPVVRYQKPLRSKFLTWLTTGENYLAQRTNLTQFQITESTEQEEIKKRLQSLDRLIRSLLAGRSQTGGKAGSRKNAS